MKIGVIQNSRALGGHKMFILSPAHLIGIAHQAQ